MSFYLSVRAFISLLPRFARLKRESSAQLRLISVIRNSIVPLTMLDNARGTMPSSDAFPLVCQCGVTCLELRYKAGWLCDGVAMCVLFDVAVIE